MRKEMRKEMGTERRGGGGRSGAASRDVIQTADREIQTPREAQEGTSSDKICTRAGAQV